MGHPVINEIIEGVVGQGSAPGVQIGQGDPTHLHDFVRVDWGTDTLGRASVIVHVVPAERHMFVDVYRYP